MCAYACTRELGKSECISVLDVFVLLVTAGIAASVFPVLYAVLSHIFLHSFSAVLSLKISPVSVVLSFII